MLALENIRNLHLEITTLCNARCPECLRNARGYPHNFGYPETSITLDQIGQIFTRDFVRQLHSVDFCGNFGDFIVNPDALEIADYFYKNNDHLNLFISTNGSARKDDFWQQLGSRGERLQVSFCIDGLEDTHALYRLDTSWTTVLSNARTFIKAGGKGIWKMIVFDHNRHQIEECRQMAKDLGFWGFDVTDHGRNFGPVFDRKGQVMHWLGGATANESNTLDNIINWQRHGPYDPGPEKNALDCYSKNKQSIYMSADGSIYPCCYLGSFPRTYVNGSWYRDTHEQLKHVLDGWNNNALAVGLPKAIEWFNEVERAWDKATYKEGRLMLCDAHCGQTYQIWNRSRINGSPKSLISQTE